MSRLLALLPLALTWGLWLPPLSLAPSASSPMDMVAGAGLPLDMPDWRTDPLGAAMEEASLIDNPWARGSQRMEVYLELTAAGFNKEAEAILEFAVVEALAWADQSQRHSALYGMAGSLEEAGVYGPVERLLLLAIEETDADQLGDLGADWIVPTALSVGSRATAERVWKGREGPNLSLERVILLVPYLAAQGENEEARKVLAEAMSVHRASGWLDPDGSDGTHNVVMLYLESYLAIGKHELARAMLAEAVSSVPANGWSDLFWDWLRVARAAHRAGDETLARELVEKSRRLARESVQFRWWNPRGDAANWWGRLMEEYRAAKQDSASTHSGLANTYTRMGMWEEARREADKVADHGLGPGTFATLGRALAEDGQGSAALEIAAILQDNGQEGRGAASVVDAVIRRRLEAGQGEEAWIVWQQYLAPSRHEPPYRLLRYWRNEGDLDALLVFLDQETQVSSAAAGARQAALATEDGDAASGDVSVLVDLVSMVLELESLGTTDEINKTIPLLEIARVFHGVGEQGEATLAMEAAEELVEEWGPGCELLWYPASQRDDSAAKCRWLESAFLEGELTLTEQKNLIMPYIAKGWAQIGEFGRAFAVVGRMVPIGEEGEDAGYGPFPRLDALAAIGIAMLEQGVRPSAYLDNLVASARQAALAPTP